MRANPIRTVFCAMVLLALVACSPASRSGMPLDPLPVPQQTLMTTGPFTPAQGEVIGSGPVRVALLLPLTGSNGTVGRAMANGARLGMDHALSHGGQNIHLVLKDSGSSPASARIAAQQAIAEGSKLIVGPLTADTVAMAGALAKSAAIPLIGFSSTASVATDGVYLLSVLPEAEIMRALVHIRAKGNATIAAIIPDTPLGRVQAEALRQAAGEAGMRVVGIELFDDEARARLAVERLAPALRSEQIDTLFLPDRATAPSFGTLLDAARVPREKLTIVGSAEWEGDRAIAAQPYLVGALYPAIDPAGLASLAPQYRARFGTEPHQLSTLAFTAVQLANSSTLTQAQPPFTSGLLAPTGFSGMDGRVRFHFDGRGEYGLVIRQGQPGGAITIDGVKLGGLPLASSGGIGVDAGIPPAAEYR